MITSPHDKSGSSSKSSAWFLILANLIPLFGVFFWDWQVLDIVALYWAENIIIGFYNALRMAWVRSESGAGAEMIEKIFMIPFFVVHYGGFCAGHGVFLFTLLGSHAGINGIEGVVWLIFGPLKWPLLALFLSHGFSFFWNFLHRREYRNTTLSKQMFAPYSRIVALHIAILAGGVAIQAAGQPLLLLIILVIGKTVMDVKLHLRSHREKKEEAKEV